MRRLAWVSAGLCVSIFCAIQLRATLWQLGVSAVLALLALAAAPLPERFRRRARLFLTGAACGMLWTVLYTQTVLAPARQLDGQTAELSAVVTDFPLETSYGSRLEVRADAGGLFPVHVRVYVFDESVQAQPGDRITFTAALQKADTLYGRESDVFAAKGVFLSARVRRGCVQVQPGRHALYFYRYIARALQAQVRTLFPADVRPLALAVLTGNRTELNADAALTNRMEICGVMHIAAVSGMHVVFLTALLTLLFGHSRRVSLLVIPVILLFMAVTGFSPSVTRAGIMNILLLLAPLVRREHDGISSLLTAASLLLLVNPYAAAGVGLQLSFASCLGLVLTADRCRAALEAPLQRCRLWQYRLPRRLLRGLAAGLAASFGAMLFSTPLIAFYFETVSLVAPVVNVLALWSVSFLFGLGLIGSALGFLWLPLGMGLAWLAVWPARFFLLVVRLFAGIPYAAVYTASVFVRGWLLYTYGMIALCLAAGRRPRQFLTAGALVCAALAGALLLSGLSSDAGALLFTALDVGQGQSLVLRSGGMTAVVDCGSSSGADAAAEVRMLLGGRGQRQIDYLFLTHFHSDHAGAVPELLETVSVRTLIVPEPDKPDDALTRQILTLAEAQGTELRFVTEDTALSLGEAQLTVFAPLGYGDANDCGLILLCSKDDTDILITGDADETTEKLLVYRRTLPDIEILVAGHHGSAFSSCETLLQSVRPEAAVISCGYNTYGHPAAETLYRLSAAGIRIYRTDFAGNIAFTIR